MNKFREYASIYIRNSTVRLNVSLLVGFLFNGMYIVFNLVSGIIYSNAWFITVAAYYTLIVSMRYLVIGAQDKNNPLASRTVGVLILILGVPITGMIIYTVLESREQRYSTVLIVALGVYALFSILRAIFGIAGSKKDNAPMRRAAHTVRLSAALMSLFNLQTALLDVLVMDERLLVFLNFISAIVTSPAVGT